MCSSDLGYRPSSSLPMSLARADAKGACKTREQVPARVSGFVPVTEPIRQPDQASRQRMPAIPIPRLLPEQAGELWVVASRMVQVRTSAAQKIRRTWLTDLLYGKFGREVEILTCKNDEMAAIAAMTSNVCLIVSWCSLITFCLAFYHVGQYRRHDGKQRQLCRHVSYLRFRQS